MGQRGWAVFFGITALFLAVFFSFLFIRNATAAVSSVVGSDADTTGYGLTGADVRVVIDVDASTPAGFANMEIYITTTSLTLTTSTLATACGGVCQSRGFFTQHADTTYTLPDFYSTDSRGAAWATGTNYIAWVYVSSTVPTIVSSSAFTLTHDAVADTNAPYIMHMSVHSAIQQVTGTIHASVFDDQTLRDSFATTTGSQYFRLYYGADVSVTNTAVTGVWTGTGDYFSFTIPSTTIGAAGATFEYYLAARDVAGNIRYFCANPSASTTAGCQASPFVVTSIASGSRSVAGIITSQGTPLENAVVLAGGFAVASVLTSATGTYSIGSLPNNTSLDIMAAKSGYCENGRFETIATSNLTDINLSLNSGSCGFFGGEEGGGSPHVMFSFPFEGSNNIPQNTTIKVGLDQAMSASSVNDTDASNAGSNVYLTSDGTTKLAGTVTYCATNSTPGCSSLPSMDSNVILFTPSATLATNTFYTLVVTEGAISENGRSIEGNRSGGGYQISFFTGGGDVSFGGPGGPTFGNGGQYMPPFVRAMYPGPGRSVPSDSNMILEFNEPLSDSTVNTTNFVLVTSAGAAVSLSSVSLDTNTKRFVTLNPTSNLTSGEYEVQVKGAVANTSNVSMRPASDASQIAFSSFFSSSGSVDAATSTLYPFITNGSTGVAVSSVFEFNATEGLDVSTLNTTNVTLQRGSTNVNVSTIYDLGQSNFVVVPSTALAPNTVYTLTLDTGVKDLSGNAAFGATQTYTYTTGNADTTAPSLLDVRCDDYSCRIEFTEPMDRKTSADGTTAFAKSVLNHVNFTVTTTAFATDQVVTSSVFTYDAGGNAVTIEGLALTAGNDFTLTVAATTADVSGNGVTTTNSGNIWRGKVESSAMTFGAFGDIGMFGPPTANYFGDSGTIGGGEFKPEGFGSFTGEQFAFGQADMAFPFNPTAGQDVNVFQVRFNPGQALQNGDQIQLTFPNGTTITSASLDTFSPFYSDMNEFGSGTVTGTTSTVNNDTKKMTVTLGISGTPGANDSYTLDLRNITNPSVPKDFSSGGYTVDIKVLRSGTTLVNKTSMPYFISQGGSNTLVVGVYASSSSSPDNVSGNVFVFGGGPSGPMDKQFTLAAGAASTTYTSLNDGCYFFGTDAFVTLGSTDYFGQMSQEPVCLNGGQTVTKNFILTSAAGGSAVTTTIKFVSSSGNPYVFGGKDIEIFAGGPGQFVVKTLTNVTTAATDGYTLRLPANGQWFIGMGPAMDKSASARNSKPESLGVVPPPSIDVIVSGLGGTPAVGAGFYTPPGTSFNNDTDTITFTFASADKAIVGKVTDGAGNALQDVDVFVHKQGFGMPIYTETASDGTFSLSVSDYGTYEINAFKDGLPSSFDQIEVKNESGTKVYFNGKVTTGSSGANPLQIKMKKADYYISGKVLDNSNNAIQYAPVFAIDTNGATVFSQTSSDGSYTVFVDNGTWTVRAELPPDKSDTCGSFSKTVTVNGENQTNQNVTPSASTCYTLSGTISVNGTGLDTVPIYIEEWSGTAPVAAGIKKPASTDSSGAYSVKVAGSKTYRVSTWHPTYGEMADTVSVSAANATKNISVTSANLNFVFTGGTAAMDAFVEVKNSTDPTKRIGEQQTGLNSNLTMSVESGQTYNYFVDVHGYGNFSGTAVAGTTTTIDVSASAFLTVTGTIKDASGNTLPGALVTFIDTTNDIVETAVADSSGVYTMEVKAGTWEVNSSLAGYISGDAAQSVSFTTNTASYDFGGSSPDQTALQVADRVISGTIRESDGSTMSEGFVWASNAEGIVVKAPIDADGSYSLPVTNGTWTIEATGPLHQETTKSGTVTIAGSDAAENLTLTAASGSSRTPESATGLVSADTGGSVNDTSGSGIKVTAGGGVLETGTDDVTLSLERNYNAPDTETLDALANATFEITATGNSSITTLNGNAEIQFDYSDLVSELPSGVDESDLQLMYYCSECGDYVPVEGGFTIDTTNNTVTGLVDHFTDFVLAYDPPAASPSPSPSPSPTPAASSGGGRSGSGGSGTTSTNPPTVPSPAAATPPAVVTQTFTVNTATAVTVGGAAHSVTVSAATDSEATITIQSDPITVTLQKDENKVLDTDGDMVNDLKVTYLGLVAGEPQVSLVNLTDALELGNAVTVNRGAYETDNRTVTLTFNATNAANLAVADSNDFTGIGFYPYSATRTWTLTEGDGTKTVYVQFKSADGGTVTASDTITLTGQGFAQVEVPGAPRVISCSLTIGKAYKSGDSPAVYYITEPHNADGTIDWTKTCTKRAFNKSNTFFTYFNSWDDVQTVTAAELAAIPNDVLSFMPWGPKYDPQYGALVKVVTDPRVYLLLGGNKHWITSESVFNGLKYGWTWIEDIAADLLDKYVSAGEITTTAAHPNYTIIKYPGSSEIYRLEPDPLDTTRQVKRHIKDMDAFRTLGFRGDRIVELDAAETYADGEKLEAPAGSITATSATNASYSFTEDLEVGDSGDAVVNLQEKLRVLGYFTHPSNTGTFGLATKAAVQAFQAAKGLPTVGMVGPMTRELLNAM